MKNKSVLLNILLAVVIVVLTIQLAEQQGRKAQEKIQQDKALNNSNEATTKTGHRHHKPNATLATIFKRKSVRNYTERKVSKKRLRILAKAGMAAPTAADKRPWAFIAITDRKTLDALGNALPYAKMLKNAPAAIAVCGDLNKAISGDGQAYWIQDCSAASENILLAAESMKLGAVWTGVHPIKEREVTVRKILQLPNHIIPLNIIAIGYPTGKETPKNKWDKSILHWEKWEETVKN